MQVGQPVKGPGALGDALGWLGLWEWVEGLCGVWVNHSGPWAPALPSQSAELTVGAGGPWVGCLPPHQPVQGFLALGSGCCAQ